ncbi:hypothetical protein N9033_00045 [bacterium]|nr:hypothetical protein [bacterium]
MSDSCDGKEAGYNFLCTSFTGARSSALSGLPGMFDMMPEDTGVAGTLEQMESNKKYNDIRPAE